MNEPPIRVCCFKRHWGVQCADGMVMCCLCFDRFEVKDLALDDGTPTDICKPCWEHDKEMVRRKNQTS